MQLVGAEPVPNVQGLDELPGKTHYLMGNDPEKWRTNVPHYAKVKYESVYPGVDLVYYGNQRQLEYDFIVAPRARPNQIRLAFGGVERLEVDQQGDLTLHHASGDLRLKRPVAYQEVDGVRRKVAAKFVLDEGDEVRFAIGAYDRGSPLVIDPVLSYSSYLGGSGNDTSTALAIDSGGNVYVTGATTSPDLPVQGSMGFGFAGGRVIMSDAFVTKLDATGTAVLYSTYFGGTGDESAMGVAVDSTGNVYVTGATTSDDFPTVRSFQPESGGGTEVLRMDAFLVKLDATGSQFLYSTYLGGSGDDSGRAVSVGAGGNPYVAGSTDSADFPLMNALQPALRGGRDAFVAKLSATGALVHSTYLGGSADDDANNLVVGPSGSAYVTGASWSADYPILNGAQQEHGGSADAFVTKLNPAGTTLVYSTYLGGESDDVGTDIHLDTEGNAHVTGITGSPDFPLVNAVQPEFGSEDLLGFDAFAAKVNAEGSALVYSTFLGGSGIDFGFCIAVDVAGNAYVTGETESSDFPTVDAIQAAPGGLNDGFLAKLDPTGTTLEFSTYLGGSGNDSMGAVAVDPSGSVYITGPSLSMDSPVTFGAFQTDSAGGMDVLVAKIVPGEPLPAVTSVSAASFSREFGLAPDSLASGFGEGLAATTESATTIQPPTLLAGTSVRITDSASTVQLAGLLAVSPGQLNYLVPGGLGSGLMLIEVIRDGQVVATETARVTDIAPALFAADFSGRGVAAALFLRVAADTTRTQDLVFDANTLEAVPIDLGEEGDQVFLLLFGTGMRGFTSAATATVGGEAVAVAGPVAQSQFPGLDQANLGPLPRSLVGRGEVDIVLTVDEKQANVVTVSFQ
jgi:uncharacterized protein (TIGR03437 family)